MKSLIFPLLFLSHSLPTFAGTAAYWRFEDGTADTPATTVNDSSPNSNDGSPVNGPVHRAITPGGFPNDDNTLSLEFDGINDVVEVPASASLDFTSPFTVEFWMRSEGNGAGQNLIIDKSHGFSNGLSGWFFQSRPASGVIDFGMGNGGGFPFVSSLTDLFDNQWHHIAGTYDGNTIELFVDGESQGSTVVGTYVDNSDPVRMGNTHTSSRYFKGQLDEIRISDEVLMPSDFLLTTPPPTTGYWRFEDGVANSAATTVADSSGNANNGTPSHGPIHRALTPEGFEGGANSFCLEFDGLNDIVEIPASESLDFSASFSIEFWMRSPGTGPGQDLIIDKSHASVTGNNGWFFQSRPSTGVVDFGIGNGSGFPVISSLTDLFDNQWHHLAGTYDGNTIEFFVDGISQGTSVVGSYSDNAGPVRMGNTGSPSFPRFFMGQLDEVRISDAVLSPKDFHLDALTAARVGTPAPATLAVETTEHFGITYSRLTGGTTDVDNVYTSNGYSYVVGLSDALAGWAPAASMISYTTPVDNGDGTESVTAYLNAPLIPNPGKGFMRIEVMAP